jgi:hypothetical protein
MEKQKMRRKMQSLQRRMTLALVTLVVAAAAQGRADGNQNEPLDRLPFHRVIDLQAGIGIPDGLHGGIELHPTNTIHLEASLGNSTWFPEKLGHDDALLESGLAALFAAAANIKYRPNVSLRRMSSGRIIQQIQARTRCWCAVRGPRRSPAS